MIEHMCVLKMPRCVTHEFLSRSNECGIENSHSLSSPYQRIDCGDFCVLRYVGTNSLFQFVGTGIRLHEKSFGAYAFPFGTAHYFLH